MKKRLNGKLDILNILKGLIIGLMCIFLYFTFSTPQASTKDFTSVQNGMLNNIDLSTMELKDNISIKRFLDLEPEMFENIIYYKSQDALNADEIVLVQFKSSNDAKTFEDKMKARIDEQTNIFSGYAPEQADKLNNSIIDIQVNYACMIVSQDAKTIHDQFLRSL